MEKMRECEGCVLEGLPCEARREYGKERNIMEEREKSNNYCGYIVFCKVKRELEGRAHDADGKGT